MGIQIKPSDLFYKYKHKKETRDAPKFRGLPDPEIFDRDDLYEVIPMFNAVMDALGSNDGLILDKIEEIMIYQMPGFIQTREDVYQFLVSTARQRLNV